jgi:CRP/FNR family transcriptional regulator, anaerobic regulatory protein
MNPRPPRQPFASVSATLAGMPLWCALEAGERDFVSQTAKLVSASKGDVLIAAGTHAQALFAVVEGALRLTRVNGRGNRIIAGFLFRGDVVGACIADRYPFAVEAISEVVLCRFERCHIREIGAVNPGLEWRMITAASNEFLQCQMHLDIVMGGSVEAKLARFLLCLASRIGRRDAAGTHVALPMGREDIAHYLGHSLETISRAFTKLREANAIATPQRHHLVVADEDTLARIADSEA